MTKRRAISPALKRIAVAVTLIAAMSAPTEAVIWCHDYVFLRLTNADPTPPGTDLPGRGPHQLRDYLLKNGYQMHGVDTLTPQLRPGDVLILREDHSGFVNPNGRIDHFIQIEGTTTGIGPSVRYNGANPPRNKDLDGKVGGLYENHTFEKFLEAPFQDGKPAEIQLWRQEIHLTVLVIDQHRAPVTDALVKVRFGDGGLFQAWPGAQFTGAGGMLTDAEGLAKFTDGLSLPQKRAAAGLRVEVSHSEIKEVWRDVSPGLTLFTVQVDRADPLADLEALVKTLEETRKQLLAKIKEIEESRKAAIAAEAEAKTLLTRLKSFEPSVIAAERVCLDAATRAKSLRDKATESGRAASAATAAFTAAAKLADACHTRQDAQMILKKHQEGVTAAARVEALKKEANALSLELILLAADQARKVDGLKDAPKLVSDISTRARTVDTELGRALKLVTEASASEEPLRQGALEVERRMRRLGYLSEDDNRPQPVQQRIDALRKKFDQLLQDESGRAIDVGAATVLKANGLVTTAQETSTTAATLFSGWYKRAVCTIDPFAPPGQQIDKDAEAAAAALRAASGLPARAKACEAKVACAEALAPVQKLLDVGDTEAAAPLLAEIKAKGCDVQEVDARYWTIHPKVSTLLSRARQSWDTADATCDYRKAWTDAQALQRDFPQHPWLAGRSAIQKAATAQEDIEKLLFQAAEADRVNRPREAEAAIARAELAADPYPCLARRVADFRRQYEMGKSLANRIASLRGRITDLTTKRASAAAHLATARAAADGAAAGLRTLDAYGDQASEIAATCKIAATLRGAIVAAAADASLQEKKVRNDMDALMAKASSCTEADARDVQAKYNEAIRTLGQVGAAAKESASANSKDLHGLLSEIATKAQAQKKGADAAADVIKECGRARTEAEAALTDVGSAEALADLFPSTAAIVRGEIDALRQSQPRLAVPNYFDRQIDELYAALDAAIAESKRIDLESIRKGAREQSARADDIQAAAEIRSAALSTVATCDVQPADDLIAHLDGVVTGLTVEIAAAADAVRKSADCVAKLNAAAGVTTNVDPPSILSSTTTVVGAATVQQQGRGANLGAPPVAPPPTTPPPSSGTTTPPAATPPTPPAPVPAAGSPGSAGTRPPAGAEPPPGPPAAGGTPPGSGTFDWSGTWELTGSLPARVSLAKPEGATLQTDAYRAYVTHMDCRAPTQIFFGSFQFEGASTTPFIACTNGTELRGRFSNSGGKSMDFRVFFQQGSATAHWVRDWLSSAEVKGQWQIKRR